MSVVGEGVDVPCHQQKRQQRGYSMYSGCECVVVVTKLPLLLPRTEKDGGKLAEAVEGMKGYIRGGGGTGLVVVLLLFPREKHTQSEHFQEC